MSDETNFALLYDSKSAAAAEEKHSKIARSLFVCVCFLGVVSLATIIIAIIVTFVFLSRASNLASRRLIKPRKLIASTSAVALVSPASPYSFKYPNTTEYLVRVQDDLTKVLNFARVKFAEHMSETWFSFAGTDKNRIEDMHVNFKDSSIDAIIANRGGYGSYQLLSSLDYFLIASNPKAFIGYSDITAVANAIFFQTGLVTFHGPVGTSSLSSDSTNVKFLKQILFSNELVTFQAALVNSSTTSTTIKEGKGRGRLFGGNLSVLTSLIGTPYLPPVAPQKFAWEELILFVEEIQEPSEKIDRMISQLKLAGILDRVAGFVFGTCYLCNGPSYSQSVEQILRNYVKVPCFMGAQIGHDGQQWTMPIGIEVEIDAAAGTITMLEKAMQD